MTDIPKGMFDGVEGIKERVQSYDKFSSKYVTSYAIEEFDVPLPDNTTIKLISITKATKHFGVNDSTLRRWISLGAPSYQETHYRTTRTLIPISLMETWLEEVYMQDYIQREYTEEVKAAQSSVTDKRAELNAIRARYKERISNKN